MLSPTATVSQVSLLLYKLHHNHVGNRKKAYKQYAPVLSRAAKVELLQKQRNPIHTIQSYSKLKMGKYVAYLELNIVPLHMQLMKKRLSVICKGKEMSAVLAHLMNTEPFFSTTQTPILVSSHSYPVDHEERRCEVDRNETWKEGKTMFELHGGPSEWMSRDRHSDSLCPVV